MDALASLLEGPRAREAFLLRSVMDPPWSLRIEDEAPLTLVAVVQGEAWIVPDDGGPVSLSAGGVALVRGPGHYSVADDPGREPQVVIHPGQVCTTLTGEPLVEAMALGVRTWGNSPTGSTVLLTGTYQHRSELSARLLDGLPAVSPWRRTPGRARWWPCWPTRSPATNPVRRPCSTACSTCC